jgi:hypothetical protein
MKILLGYWVISIRKWAGKISSKPIIGNKSLHEISNDNGVWVEKFATSKNLVV